jgi:hypothetical protein
LDIETFRALISPAGQEVLRATSELNPQEASFLRHFEALSRRYPSNLARAALEIAILRQEAGDKYPFAERMYFTRPALEQASNYIISTYRARRFSGFDRLFDLGCSIGSDTLALAAQAPTTGIDLDPLRLAMARANMEALGLSAHTAFVQADLTSPAPFSLSPKQAFERSVSAFFDPARRTGARRAFSVHDYHPPLAVIKDWLPHCAALGVKISPGVKLDELRSYDAEIEFISLKGELKEAVLWFGPLKTAERRATVLPGPYTFNARPDRAASLPPGTVEHPQQALPLRQPGAYLYEPDPSIMRAGLVQALSVQLDAAQLDVDIAYLTSDHLAATNFARAWAVDTWLPFGIKRLREVLRQRGVERVVVKKRGSPLQPEDLIRRLRLRRQSEGNGGADRVLFLTHLRGRPIVVICFP